MMKLTVSLDEIGCNSGSEIGEMLIKFDRFMLDQFDFCPGMKNLEFDLDNNEVSIPIEVIVEVIIEVI